MVLKLKGLTDLLLLLVLCYLNPEAIKEAIRDRWYMNGDLGVRQSHGSITKKDRRNDIMYCKGEVEVVLLNHPKILEVVVEL